MRCLQKAEVPHRLTLIYLANDIVQNAKRKNTLSFIEDFKSILKDTVPYLRDDKIRKSVERVFSIWQDRSVFDSKFTTELKSSLNNTGRQSQHHKQSSVKSLTPEKGKSPTDLMDSLAKLASIEKNVEKLKSTDDNIIDKVARGEFSDKDSIDPSVMNDLKTYIITLKNEIDERNKLSRLLEETMTTQKKLLKESEDQLVVYKSQLDYISKLRDDLG